MQDTPYDLFLQRAALNLHCVLCLPPGEDWLQLLCDLPVIASATHVLNVPEWSPAALQVCCLSVTLLQQCLDYIFSLLASLCACHMHEACQSQ